MTVSETIANVLSKTLPDETIADILECLLGSDENENLNDTEAEEGMVLFESLCTLRRDCVELAQSR